jgi:hypothetical protein
MTDLTELRAEVVHAREQAATGDPLARASASGLTTVYNRLVGTLDGMRYARREFFLLLDQSHDISGTIDEPLVSKVETLLNREVAADVERVVTRDGAGHRRRPAYRLVGLRPAAEPLDL